VFGFANDFIPMLLKVPQKIMRIIGGCSLGCGPVAAGICTKDRPDFISEFLAGFGDDPTHNIQTFSQENTSLKFHLSRVELRKRRTVALGQVELRG